MYKLTYYINASTENPNDFDPNLDRAVKDIIRRKKNESVPGNFDFEVAILFDGFISSSELNTSLTTFLRDMISGPEPYFISNDENKLNNYVEYVKMFILFYNNPNQDINMSNRVGGAHIYSLDVFKESENTDLSIHIFIPEEKNDSIKSKLASGSDYMVAVLSVNEMFEHFIPLLYKELYRLNLLDDENYKRLSTYKIVNH